MMAGDGDDLDRRCSTRPATHAGSGFRAGLFDKECGGEDESEMGFW